MAKSEVATQFPKGVSGNPKGRPKGSKNKHKISKRRDAIEHALMRAAAGQVESLVELMKDTIQDARTHENPAIRMQNRKLVFDKLLPATIAPKEAGEAEDNTLVIKIGTVQLGEQGVVEKAIEGELANQQDDQ